MIHERFIFPVGQGGFAGEIIGNFVVVYDCGSVSSPTKLERCIDHASNCVSHVDLLFISHFDNDHVNGIRYLLNHVNVVKAVVSWIPDELRVAYGVYTRGAYTAIMGLLRERRVEVTEIGEEEKEEQAFGFNAIWEWIAKSMMTSAELRSIVTNMQNAGMDLARLVADTNYLESQKENINNAFKTVFGSKGPNAKGLIMLSQRCQKMQGGNTELLKSCWCRCSSRRRLGPYKIGQYNETSCLYVGDADLRNRKNHERTKEFLDRRMKDDVLMLMQMPHHGSRYNICAKFETEFAARYYFVNDISTVRIRKHQKLYGSLMMQRKLLVTRVFCRNMIMTETRI